jgi:Zn-dependent metalloprotease
VKRIARFASSTTATQSFAIWDGIQMLYGQELFDGKLRSMASSLSVVAHELFHGVTGATARLIYLGETGALNESYSDIFGTLVANGARPDIAKWDWQVGCGVAIRDMQDPTRQNQPKLMKDFINVPLTQKDDSGGVHFNSGIHNYAAFNVMSANDGRKFIFRPQELAAMFYVALTQAAFAPVDLRRQPARRGAGDTVAVPQAAAEADRTPGCGGGSGL